MLFPASLFSFRNTVLGEATWTRQLAPQPDAPTRRAYRHTAARLFALLLKHCPAGFADVGFLPSQAGGDCTLTLGISPAQRR
jgi:hypothetical protein